MGRKTIFFFLFIISASITGCKKYPDGPNISLLTRKARMANIWKLDTYSENGVDKTGDFHYFYRDAQITFEKNGSYLITYKALGSIDYSESGVWHFINGQKDFETIPDSGTGSYGLHHLLRLKSTELWYYDDGDNGLRKEIHLKQ